MIRRAAKWHGHVRIAVIVETAERAEAEIVGVVIAARRSPHRHRELHRPREVVPATGRAVRGAVTVRVTIVVRDQIALVKNAGLNAMIGFETNPGPWPPRFSPWRQPNSQI